MKSWIHYIENSVDVFRIGVGLFGVCLQRYTHKGLDETGENNKFTEHSARIFKDVQTAYAVALSNGMMINKR